MSAKDINPRKDQTMTLAAAIHDLIDRVGTRYLLSLREKEVLRLSAAGMHTKRVASNLGCSPKTVEVYWQRMFRKTQQNSRHEIVAQVLAEAIGNRMAK